MDDMMIHDYGELKTVVPALAKKMICKSTHSITWYAIRWVPRHLLTTKLFQNIYGTTSNGYLKYIYINDHQIDVENSVF